MRLKSFSVFLLVAMCHRLSGQQLPKIVAECTITYSVNIHESKSDNEMTTKKLYIKGHKTRSEVNNPSFYQATIFDNKTGDAVVLKEVGGDKYLYTFTADQWKEKNSQWDNVSVKLSDDKKTILNYPCRKAIITMKNGSSFVVYFTTDLIASANENPYQFKGISGLILEYESQDDNGKTIELKAIDVNFSPVPAAKFTIPTTGYRTIQ